MRDELIFLMYSQIVCLTCTQESFSSRLQSSFLSKPFSIALANIDFKVDGSIAPSSAKALSIRVTRELCTKKCARSDLENAFPDIM